MHRRDYAEALLYQVSIEWPLDYAPTTIIIMMVPSIVSSLIIRYTYPLKEIMEYGVLHFELLLQKCLS